ncbi:MAG TPA: DUF3618 domain-containing protein [Gaiellales bacterium]|jgi:hypothetical protein
MGQDTREVREQVEEAREQLGDTVAALAHKANAPKRAKDRAAMKLDGLKRRVNGVLGRRGAGNAPR